MTGRERMSEAAIATAIAALPHWERRGEQLHRTFSFRDFVTAFAFMAEVAQIAEELGHHPDWRNVYRTVEVALTTHDAGGLTSLDFELAARMDAAAARRGSHGFE